MNVLVAWNSKSRGIQLLFFVLRILLFWAWIYNGRNSLRFFDNAILLNYISSVCYDKTILSTNIFSWWEVLFLFALWRLISLALYCSLLITRYNTLIQNWIGLSIFFFIILTWNFCFPFRRRVHASCLITKQIRISITYPGVMALIFEEVSPS
jgi:hypothetical protein